MTSSAMALANEFLKMPGALGRLTQMHLQKLVYISHGWSLALRDVALTSDEIEAWDYGPVFPDLYDHTKFNGKSPLMRLIKPSDGNPFSFWDGEVDDDPYEADLSSVESDVLKHVWRKYGRLSAFKLSDLTHKRNTPWHWAYHNGGRRAPIDNEHIKDHYRKLAALI